MSTRCAFSLSGSSTSLQSSSSLHSMSKSLLAKLSDRVQSRGPPPGIESLALACLSISLDLLQEQREGLRNSACHLKKFFTRMLSQRCWKGHLYSGSRLPWLRRKNHPQKTSIPDGWAQGKHSESKHVISGNQDTGKELYTTLVKHSPVACTSTRRESRKSPASALLRSAFGLASSAGGCSSCSLWGCGCSIVRECISQVRYTKPLQKSFYFKEAIPYQPVNQSESADGIQLGWASLSSLLRRVMGLSEL